MTDWVDFFQTLAIATGKDRNKALLPYEVAVTSSDAGTNKAAATYNMLPLPGGRDFGMAELAETWARENSA